MELNLCLYTTNAPAKNKANPISTDNGCQHTVAEIAPHRINGSAVLVFGKANEWTVLPATLQPGPWARTQEGERRDTCDRCPLILHRRRTMRNMRRCFYAVPSCRAQTCTTAAQSTLHTPPSALSTGEFPIGAVNLVRIFFLRGSQWILSHVYILNEDPVSV